MHEDVLRMARLADQGIDRREVVRLARRVLSSPAWRDVEAFWHAVMALAYAGELETANEECARALSAPDWATTGRHHTALRLLRARIASLRGHPGTAAALLDDARDTEERFHGLAVAWSVAALVDLGELDRAHGLLLECDPAAAGDQAELLAARAGLHLAAGRVELAGEDFRECGRVLVERGVVNSAVVPWRSRAALCAHLLDHKALAAALAQQELAAAQRWGCARAVGVAMHAAALIFDGTADALREAETVLEKCGAVADLIRVRHDLAWSLHATKEHRSALTLLEQTRDLAERAGYRWWTEHLTAAIVRMVRAEGISRLTRQERRIAALARAGLSNRQIAEELSLTMRTVEFHLTSVYRKLAIAGRRDLRAIVTPLS
jgi:DNA-binding CsgD family transcriptional regulator